MKHFRLAEFYLAFVFYCFADLNFSHLLDNDSIGEHESRLELRKQDARLLGIESLGHIQQR